MVAYWRAESEAWYDAVLAQLGWTDEALLPEQRAYLWSFFNPYDLPAPEIVACEAREFGWNAADKRPRVSFYPRVYALAVGE